ncbi:MAG: CatB-related O-acetyltransferase [Planctomycetota bacterium]|jgi:acetyltransferase-like isoleucine patch superfamily enzyme
MWLSELLYRLYAIKRRTIRNAIRGILLRLEGGEMYSTTLRRIFKEYHKIEIGMYSHGGCFVPGSVDAGTTIGRYCSIANGVRVINRDHPMDFKSMHALFFNPLLKYCHKHLAEPTPLKIGNDVWIGTRAVILRNVTEIGDGAVIGAGAIIGKNVQPYAVVIGNPARVVRYRFPQEVIDELLASRWWEKDIEELKPHIDEFQRPYERSDRRGEISAEKVGGRDGQQDIACQDGL